MPYQITGTLKLPDGSAASNIDIEFVPLVSVSPVIRDLSNVIRTSSSGAYSIQLQYGEYSVKLTPVFGYQISAGRVSVDRGTQAGMDLPTLLALYDESSTAPSYAKQIAQWLAEAKASASAAKVSETNAKASEVAAKSSETNAKSSETKAKASEVAAEDDRLEVAANTALVASAQADVASKHADVLSAASQVATDKLAVAEDAAESAASSLVAVTKATEASASASAAKGSEVAAKASELAAKRSEDLAEADASEVRSIRDLIVPKLDGIDDAVASTAADKVAAAASASSASQSASSAAIDAGKAKAEADRAKGYADSMPSTENMLLKTNNLSDLASIPASRLNLGVPSTTEVSNSISTAIAGVTPESIGARPDTWMPTTDDIGAAKKTDLEQTNSNLSSLSANHDEDVTELHREDARLGGNIESLSKSVLEISPATSGQFNYEAGVLVGMRETLQHGTLRDTQFNYDAGGRLTSSVAHIENRVITTTYNYADGSLVGYQVVEEIA